MPSSSEEGGEHSKQRCLRERGGRFGNLMSSGGGRSSDSGSNNGGSDDGRGSSCRDDGGGGFSNGASHAASGNLVKMDALKGIRKGDRTNYR
jgi:hypothetical protein